MNATSTHLHRRITCPVPGHGARCVVAQEKPRRYARCTERRIALAYETTANGRVETGSNR